MSVEHYKYFEEYILPCHRYMYAAALSITGSKDNAIDAVQSAMLKIWELVSRNHKIDNPSSYCVATVRNICLNEKKRIENNVYFDDKAYFEVQENPQEGKSDFQDVNTAINLLGDKEIKVLKMRAFAGCSTQQIADSLSISTENVRKILSRARKKLKNTLSQ